jgi:hypothetical protein
MKKEFDLVLPNAGNCHVTIDQGKQLVFRKTYVRNARGEWEAAKKNGDFIRVIVDLDGVSIEVNLENGPRLFGRSCCKHPDVFKGRVGKKLALKHLVKGSILSKDDRKELFHAVMRNGKPRKEKKNLSAPASI